jgi:predicted ArsR family transcriptional regulator
VATDTTRERVLSLIASAGPITAAALADKLGLTSAAVRRHLGALMDDGLIADHDVPGPIDRGRGRPAKSFVATAVGQRALQSAYTDVAREAMTYLRDRGDLDQFVEAHTSRLQTALAEAVDQRAPIEERVEALSEALADQGYATSVRPGPGGYTLQLCQGHCPVQEIAQVAPEWCEAEARAFSSVLNVHVQRLSTLVQGAHVCTTTIPLTPALKEG